MIIKILGAGCNNCRLLEDNAKKAVGELGLAALVEKVTALKEITSYGVLRTPALVIDGDVKTMGRIPTVEEIKEYLPR